MRLRDMHVGPSHSQHAQGQPISLANPAVAAVIAAAFRQAMREAKLVSERAPLPGQTIAVCGDSYRGGVQ